MRSTKIVAILTAMIKLDSYGFDPLPELFHEQLKMLFHERAPLREVLVIVCEGYEGIFFVHLGFVYTTYCPLPRSIDAAANALTTRKADFYSRTLLSLPGDAPPWCLKGNQRVKASHLQTMAAA